MTQPRLFDGYEVQSQELRIPGVKKPVALFRFLPEGAEPHDGDRVKYTIEATLTFVPGTTWDNAGERGEVKETWTLVPLTETFAVEGHVSRDQLAVDWDQEHGAA